ncbi:MAG: hypothetical protein SGI71_11060 [Verrucomicrobiota bacterium]|nr:hypothetical protein [Verrucomicrobiota bacterium]
MSSKNDKVPLTVLILRSDDPTFRPRFTDLSRKMIAGRLDVKLMSKADYMSLYKALSRAGFGLWSRKTNDNEWYCRIRRKNDTQNPLIREIKREYQPEYIEWKQYCERMLRGEKLKFDKEAHATRLVEYYNKFYRGRKKPEISSRGKTFFVAIAGTSKP